MENDYVLVHSVTKTIWRFTTHRETIDIQICDKVNAIYLELTVSADKGQEIWGILRNDGWLSLEDDLLKVTLKVPQLYSMEILDAVTDLLNRAKPHKLQTEVIATFYHALPTAGNTENAKAIAISEWDL